MMDDDMGGVTVPGIEDVARAAGVSTATVSRALSGRTHVAEATRVRVLTAAKELGYVVSSAASSLASGRTRNVGVIVPYIDRWFFSTVLSGVTRVLAEHGYDVTLYAVPTDTEGRHAVFDTSIRRGRVDAIIVVSIQLDQHETDDLLSLGIPVVALGGPNEGLRALSVDDEAVARDATDHLIGLGHVDIGHIGARTEFDLDFHLPSQRRRGYEEALLSVGLAPRPEWQAQADFTIAGGDHAAHDLLSSADRPSAIFAASDEMAIGAILAARNLGLRVPEDVSIIGVDGHELGAYFGLTTVSQRPARQGERAAEAVLRDLGEDIPGTESGVVAHELIIRSSTAAR